VGLIWYWCFEGTLCYCWVFKGFSLALSVDVAGPRLCILALGNETQHSTASFLIQRDDSGDHRLNHRFS